MCVFNFFEVLEKRFNSRKLVNMRGLREVSIGMLYKDIRDVNDGFQGTTAACREHSTS